MNTDKDLLKYCKDNNFPVNEMTIENFKTVKNSLGYNQYKLSKIMNEIILENLTNPVLKSLEIFKNKIKGSGLDGK